MSNDPHNIHPVPTHWRHVGSGEGLLVYKLGPGQFVATPCAVEGCYDIRHVTAVRRSMPQAIADALSERWFVADADAPMLDANVKLAQLVRDYFAAKAYRSTWGGAYNLQVKGVARQRAIARADRELTAAIKALEAAVGWTSDDAAAARRR